MDDTSTIISSLERIEQKLDGVSAWTVKHTAEDDEVHRQVKALRRQRGFVSGLLAGLVAIGAGIAYAVRWLLGRH